MRVRVPPPAPRNPQRREALLKTPRMLIEALRAEAANVSRLPAVCAARS